MEAASAEQGGDLPVGLGEGTVGEFRFHGVALGIDELHVGHARKAEHGYSFGKGATFTECIAFMPRLAGLNQQISFFTSERKYDLNVET